MPCNHLMERTDLLNLFFLISYCEVVTFPLISWFRCGVWLYWFPIFTFILKLKTLRFFNRSFNVKIYVITWHTYIFQPIEVNQPRVHGVISLPGATSCDKHDIYHVKRHYIVKALTGNVLRLRWYHTILQPKVISNIYVSDLKIKFSKIHLSPLVA